MLRRPVFTMHKLLTGRHVLVVEDEVMVRLLIEVMLENLGCQSVTAAATIDQALDWIEKQTFDAAVLDVNLNGQKSYPVADALAARGVPFVFSTGYSEHGMNDGYSDRPALKKPFREKELEAAMAPLFPH